jgi:hypothetical protein
VHTVSENKRHQTVSPSSGGRSSFLFGSGSGTEDGIGTEDDTDINAASLNIENPFVK